MKLINIHDLSSKINFGLSESLGRRDAVCEREDGGFSPPGEERLEEDLSRFKRGVGAAAAA